MKDVATFNTSAVESFNPPVEAEASIDFKLAESNVPAEIVTKESPFTVNVSTTASFNAVKVNFSSAFKVIAFAAAVAIVKVEAAPVLFTVNPVACASVIKPPVILLRFKVKSLVPAAELIVAL